MDNEQIIFYVYTTDGTNLGEYDLSGFEQLVKINYLNTFYVNNVAIKKIKSSLLGDKGYGYCYGYFVSYRDITILSVLEQRKWADNYFSLSYARLTSYFKNCMNFNLDRMQDAILYIYNRLNSIEGVNNIEQTLKLKYFSLHTDIYRKTKTKNNIVTDSLDPDTILLYEKNAKINIDEYEVSCSNQVNDLKLNEMVTDELYNHFKNTVVDMYIDYVQNFRNIRANRQNQMLKSGVRGLALKYKISISTAKNRIRDIKQFIKDKKDEILNRFNIEKYPTTEELTLKNLIFD